jgi:[glutamine synthetase] adenylyltransferase / [glutamine synthetase]-adenylyl-L-tyrosine phosphorylase
MKQKPDYSVVAAKCPGIPEETVKRHFESLHDEYFQYFDPNTVAEHIAKLHSLSADGPVKTIVRIRENGEIECTILAADYPSVFSLITGLLGVKNFNIISGSSFTYRQVRREPPSRYARYNGRTISMKVKLEKKRKIIDFFTGRIADAVSIRVWQAEFETLLGEVFRLLEAEGEKGIDAAKRKVHEYVAEALSERTLSDQAILFPVDISIGETTERTKLSITSVDTPFFLYAVSTALGLHRVSIESVHIQTIGKKAVDEFEIADLKGNSITSRRQLNQIKFSILFTKQFTYFLWKSPDPFRALLRFENILQDMAEHTEDMGQGKYLSDPTILKELARLLGASDFLWEDFIRTQYETILPLLSPRIKQRYFSHTPEEMESALREELKISGTLGEKKEVLNSFKDRETYLIDLDHILQKEADFLFLSRKLTCLAELIVSTAVSIVWDTMTEVHGTPRTVAGIQTTYAILGLGKLGGAALGYASDIELLFVYSDQGESDGKERIPNAVFFEELFKQAVLLIDAKREGIFRVDLRLRPHGKSGPIACSLEEFCRYYGAEGQAHAFELLALIRMRPFGGDTDLGSRIERLRDEYVFATNRIDLQELRTLREKQLQEKTDPCRQNAKFSPGALVDLEYTVQILQYLYARDNPALKTPRIHVALEELARGGIMSERELKEIVAAYHFFRKLINGLRMLRGSAEDLFLPDVDSDEYLHLARRIGYEPGEGFTPARQLSLDFQTTTATIRRFVEHYLGRDWIPEESTGNAADLVLSDSLPMEPRNKILSAAGFFETRRAYVNLKALAGEGRRRRLFARLSVLAWDVLAQSPAPDMALNNWERFEHSIADIENHYSELLRQPKRLELLLQIFASSQFLADILIKYPEFYNWVTDPVRIRSRRLREDIAADLRRETASAESEEEWERRVRKFRKREILRIATRDICLLVSIEEITAELSHLADAIIENTLAYIRRDAPPLPFCICAFGKLGGGELNYSSDLDLIGIYAAPEGRGKEETERTCGSWMEKLRALLSDHTDEGYVYRIDLRLRPYGRSGNIVYSRDALVGYYHHTASLWEVQALLKLRPVAGDTKLGEDFLSAVRPVLVKEYIKKEVIETITTLRAEAVKKSADSVLNGKDIKSGEGGIRDIEFLLQGFQLVFCKRFPEVLTGNTLEGVRRLGEQGLMPVSTAAALAEDYTFLRRTEHFLQILEDRQTHTLPKVERERELLAKRMSRRGMKHDEFYSRLEETLRRVHRAYETYLLGMTEAPPAHEN